MNKMTNSDNDSRIKEMTGELFNDKLIVLDI